MFKYVNSEKESIKTTTPIFKTPTNEIFNKLFELGFTNDELLSLNQKDLIARIKTIKNETELKINSI